VTNAHCTNRQQTGNKLAATGWGTISQSTESVFMKAHASPTLPYLVKVTDENYYPIIFTM